MAVEEPFAAQLRAASAAQATADAKRKAAAQAAVKQVQALLQKRENLEAQQREAEERRAKANAAKVAKEVAKFWKSCCRAALYFEVQRRHAVKTQKHFENIQALVSKSEAFSSEVSNKLLEEPKDEESSSSEVNDPPTEEQQTASPDLGAAPGRRTQPMQPSELETASSELASDNFDRRCMSNKITTEVPTLLLRHPIREYQHVGLHWLATLHDKDFNGILADEMGLGKTIMTIALLAHLAIQKEVWGPHLIVVPSSVLLNWVKELKKWTPGLKVCAYFGDPEERRLKRRGWGVEDAFHVCVVSYSVALQDVRFLKRRRWYYMILDEAQHIKNFRSQKWQQLMRFNTERRLLLTGTPLQNNLTELWSLMHFLMPDMFQSYHDFKEFFSDPLQLALHEKRVDQEQDLVARLHKVLRPFLLRRLKSEVERQLPNKHEYVVRCPLSRRQQVLYEEFMQRRETQRVLKKGDYISMMGILMQLRKVCNHPELFEPRCAVTAFVMCQLDFQLPGDVLLALWQCVAGRRPGEENFCSLLMPLLSLWRLELSMMQLSRADLPLNEVIEVELPMKRRRIMPTLPASPLRKHLSPQSQRFLDESYLAHLGQEEERRDQRRSVAVAVDYLMWLVMQGRPWIGSNGLQLLSQCVSSSLCSRGRRSFLWPEPRRSSSVFCDARQRQVDGSALENLSGAIYGDLLMNWRSRLGLWAFCVSKVQVYTSSFATTPTDPMLGHVRLVPHLSAMQLAPWLRFQQLSALFSKRICSGAGGPVADALAGPLRCHLPEKHYLESDCGKLRALAGLLQRFKERKDKCIIFTQFIKMLDVLEAFVCYHRLTYLRLDGSVKVDVRQDLVDRFNEDERVFLFICSTRAGGVGINLTSANVVIFYDSDWNPAMDRQATDRAHRIGQQREVHIYRLISEHTVEENIWQRQLQKRALDDIVVDQGQFNTEKLMSLQGQGSEGGDVIWTAAEVRSLLDASCASEPEEAAPCSMEEFQAVLQHVEDSCDAQMTSAALSEAHQAEKMLKGDFHTAPARKKEATQKMEWLSLPRLVRWGVHRVRLLQVEEALAQRRAKAGPRGEKRKRKPNVA